MGADYIEYMIADPTTVPQELESFYSEKIIRMPHSYLVTDHLQTSTHVINSEKGINISLDVDGGEGQGEGKAEVEAGEEKGSPVPAQIPQVTRKMYVNM